MAGRRKSRGILLPLAIVEIRCQELTGVVIEERIKADDMDPCQMIIDNLICQGHKLPMPTGGTLHARLFANSFSPFILADRRVAGFPLR